jgi:hypothetical protein
MEMETVAGQWYCEIDGEELGPLSAQQLRKMVVLHNITPSSRIRKGTTGEWITASRVRGLFTEAQAETSAEFCVGGLATALPRRNQFIRS